MVHQASSSVFEAPSLSTDRVPVSASTEAAPAVRTGGSHRRRGRRPWLPDALVAGVLAIYGFAIWLPYELHASFLLDDFTLTEHFRLGTPLPSYRPGFIAVMQGEVRAFGTHPRGYYVSLAVLMAALGVLLYLALRQLGLDTVPSVIAGALIVAYPRADALGLWWTGSQMGIALCLGLLSVLLGAMWVRRTGREPVLLLLSLAALAGCILTYEAMVPVFLLPLCLFPLSANRGRLLVKAGFDLVMVVVSSLVMFELAFHNQQTQQLSRYPRRAAHLAADGWRALFVHGLYHPTLIGVIAGVSVAVATVVVLLVVRAANRLTELGRWQRLLMAVPLLIACTFVAWVPYIPALDWYDPLLPNIGNHVNALAQVFLITAAAVAIWLLSRLVTAPFRTPALAAVLAAGGAIVLISGFVGQVGNDQSQYTAASVHRVAILAKLHRLIPHPAPGTEVLLGDYHVFVGASWVEVFETTWDTTAAVQTAYDDARLRAAPLTPGAVCRPTGLAEPGYGLTSIPYAKLAILDIARSRVVHLDNQFECELELPSLLAQPAPAL